jgi:ribosomal protein L28
MARRCEICGKGSSFGRKISHAHNVTSRRFQVNLQTVRAVIAGGGPIGAVPEQSTPPVGAAKTAGSGKALHGSPPHRKAAWKCLYMRLGAALGRVAPRGAAVARAQPAPRARTPGQTLLGSAPTIIPVPNIPLGSPHRHVGVQHHRIAGARNSSSGRFRVSIARRGNTPPRQRLAACSEICCADVPFRIFVLCFSLLG